MVSYYKSSPPQRTKEREFLVKYFIHFRKVVCTFIMGEVGRRLQIPILARSQSAMVSSLLFPEQDLNCGCVCRCVHYSTCTLGLWSGIWCELSLVWWRPKWSLLDGTVSWKQCEWQPHWGINLRVSVTVNDNCCDWQNVSGRRTQDFIPLDKVCLLYRRNFAIYYSVSVA